MVLGDFRSRASCSMKARMSGFSCTRGQQAQLIVCIFVLLLVSGMFPQDITKVIPLNRHLVGGNPEIAKFFSWFDRHAMLIAHFRCPLSPHAPDMQPPDLIGTTSGGHPNENGSSIVSQRIVGIARMGM